MRHYGGEYVIGAVHTNTIEGFWSIFKRGVGGAFHKVSKKNTCRFTLPNFSSATTNRDNPDIFGAAIAVC